MLQDIPAPEPPLPLRLPDWPLPDYRYVPGLHPHPFRMEGGHMYTDGGAPEVLVWQPSEDWRADRHWLRGLDLFDQRFYWECHEAFEAMWHALERDSLLHRLSQGLIQASASVLKRHMGQDKSASLLAERAISRLESVQAQAGDHCRGVVLPALCESIQAFQFGGPWPHLERS